MNQENLNYESEDIFGFLSNKCTEFAAALDLQEEGELDSEHKQLWCQNFVALDYPHEVVKDFIMLNENYSQEELEWLEDSIEKWESENYKCYGCIKMGCSEEDTECCFGKCNRNVDGHVTNSIYTIASYKHYKDYKECEDAIDRMDVVFDKIDSGNKEAVFSEQSLKDLATIKKVMPDKYTEIIEDFTDKKIDINKLERKLATGGSGSGKDIPLIALTEENAISPELLSYVGYKSGVDVVISNQGWLYGYDKGLQTFVNILAR